MGKVLWRRRGYQFDIYPVSADWNPIGGVYIFSRFNYENQIWETLYVGKTESFRTRICRTHEKWFPAAFFWGATHVLARVIPLAGMRAEVEQALIEEFDPPLNIQLRPKSADPWAFLFPPLGFGQSR